MNFSSYRYLNFQREGRVLTVELNRPQALNAIDGALHEELARVFVDCALDPDSDIIILTGAGRAFCAGGDIPWMQSMIDDRRNWDKTAREARQIIFSLLDCEKPILAKVNGHATGLGATLALFCDVIFAADGAKIGDPHVSVGLVAGDGGAVIWPQLIGYARAKEFLFSGELMTAAEAERLGLINKVVPREQLDEAVRIYAKKLESGATLAIRWTKLTINSALRTLAASVLETSLAYEGRSSATTDHQEAITAFRERRSPVFTGN
jgi:enoyl-CoA hydratase